MLELVNRDLMLLKLLAMVVRRAKKVADRMDSIRIDADDWTEERIDSVSFLANNDEEVPFLVERQRVDYLETFFVENVLLSASPMMAHSLLRSQVMAD